MDGAAFHTPKRIFSQNFATRSSEMRRLFGLQESHRKAISGVTETFSQETRSRRHLTAFWTADAIEGYDRAIGINFYHWMAGYDMGGRGKSWITGYIRCVENAQ